MSEDYDWSAEIARLPMPVLLIFADNDSVPQSTLPNSSRFGRRGEGTRLGEYEVVEVAARDRPRLQPLQLPVVRGSAADCRQVPGGSDDRRAGGAAAGLTWSAQAVDVS